MTEAAQHHELVVLPPVADDPVFADERGSYASRADVLGAEPHQFAALYMRHRWSFALHARRFLHDQRDVDEVVQEGFLKLFLALPELENELQALAYARRTITNLCIDRYRADQRRPRLVDLEGLELADDEDIDPVVAAEDAAIVREALALLSPLHREALIKREVEEKPLPVIAEELDIPVEQVKHVLHRARRSMRRLLVGTAVEPGVDLDLATVLAANRARMAAAAKPTGAAVVALLLVLAGVIGLRSTHGPTRITGGGPISDPGLLGDPLPPHGTVGIASTPTAPAVHAKPTRTLVQHHSSPAVGGHTSKPTAAPVTTAAPVVPAAAPPVTPPVTKPVVPPVAQPEAQPVSANRLSLSGLLSATSQPAITSSETFTHSAGTTAQFSQFVAPTVEGQVVLTQTLSSASDGSVSYVADAALPVSGASVPATLATGTSSITRNADGTVGVLLETSFSLPSTTGALPETDRFSVQALYASDLTTVLAERVIVGGPSDPLSPLSATPGNLPGEIPADGATVRPVTTVTNVSLGRENPEGRDQDPLPSS